MSNNLVKNQGLNSKNKVGLVLSGGGAKGAYHVGVARALDEMNIGIDMISGASIGALNGAVLASAPNFTEGAKRLEMLWDKLPYLKPIQFDSDSLTSKFNLSSISKSKVNYLIYITILLSAGLRLGSPIGWLSFLIPGITTLEIENILKDDTLRLMLEEYLDIDHLQHSMPLYVSIFKQQHNGKAIKDMVLAIRDVIKVEIAGIDNTPSEFRHIQSLAIDEQKEVLLASASVPLLFKALSSSQDERYTDGGQGGYLKSQGNTPITPLIEAGCNHIIVTHLTDGSLWHRHDFPDTSIIEIRPSINIGGSIAMFDFSVETVNKLVEAGYQDTKQALKNVKFNLDIIHSMRQDNLTLSNTMNDTEGTDVLDNAMRRLRGNK
ncbi:patatin-like phospholipase family protein [Psychrobacter sp. 72-O-c]|uniref:patatin-like phospholipase family protein n=1 Tax=Psychrobacter sp. 72-O-c TaxID=2774125 RepID=UPI001917A50D|nr:patatin-like phospholipase family protein [Psychrobacter sp. 72-O-c]